MALFSIFEGSDVPRKRKLLTITIFVGLMIIGFFVNPRFLGNTLVYAALSLIIGLIAAFVIIQKK